MSRDAKVVVQEHSVIVTGLAELGHCLVDMRCESNAMICSYFSS